MLSPEATDNLAIAVLFALPAALIGWGLVLALRSNFTPIQAVLVLLSKLMSRVLWRARYKGTLPIPPGQGAVIVCNHTSGVDPWFIQLACDRPVHWMVATEYYHHPAMNWFFRLAMSIPVNRGGVDTSATKLAIRLAETGHLVGLFPEGRINLTDELLLPGRPGAALIALRARVPVVPCYISGAPHSESVPHTLVTPAKATLVIGSPIDLTPYQTKDRENGVLKDLTLRFLREIAALAGRPDYEPKLAGRRWKPEEAE
ncbi:MAG: lysophospholipid acyltransferase family protein [Pirellulales bacterium]